MELEGPKVYMFEGATKGDFGLPVEINLSKYTLQHEMFHVEMFAYIKNKVKTGNPEDIFNQIPIHIHEEYVLNRLLKNQQKWKQKDLDLDFKNLNGIRDRDGFPMRANIEELKTWKLEFELQKLGIKIE